MGILKPTFSLTQNASTAKTDVGPISMALSLTTPAVSITCDNVNHKIVTIGTTAALLYDGSKMATSHGVEIGQTDVTSEGEGGTVGSFIYLLNTSAVDSGTTNVIYVGVDHDGGGTSNDDISDNDQTEDGSKTTRLFTLKCGEFAFFPFDYTMDIIIDANLAGQTLECWHWNRSAS
jgi:hypothetical protein